MEFRPKSNPAETGLYEVSSSLEYRLLRMAAAAGALATILSICFEFLITDRYPAMAVEFSATLFFIWILFKSRTVPDVGNLAVVFVAGLWFILNLAFWFAGGFGDGYATIVILATGLSLILIPRKFWSRFIAIAAVDIVVMMTAEYLVPWVRTLYGDDQRIRALIGGHVFIVINFVLVTIIFAYLKIRYEEVRSLAINQSQRLQSLNEALKDSNTILQQRNEAFVELNAKLEKKVEARTAELQDYQRRLTEAAFFNSHRMRRPVANILGILHVIAPPGNNEGTDNWLELLRGEAQAMDEQIREVQEVLDTRPEGILKSSD